MSVTVVCVNLDMSCIVCSGDISQLLYYMHEYARVYVRILKYAMCLHVSMCCVSMLFQLEKPQYGKVQEREFNMLPPVHVCVMRIRAITR